MSFSVRLNRRVHLRGASVNRVSPFPILLRTYPLGFWLLITLLVLWSGPGYGEWVALGHSDSGTTAYVDTGTLRPDGNHIRMWILYDFKTTHTAAGGSFFSSKAQSEYDCAVARHRTFEYTRFSGKMGTGKVVFGEPAGGQWAPVTAKSIGHMLWSFACSKE
jgi:hypothetical protein